MKEKEYTVKDAITAVNKQMKCGESITPYELCSRIRTKLQCSNHKGHPMDQTLLRNYRRYRMYTDIEYDKDKKKYIKVKESVI